MKRVIKIPYIRRISADRYKAVKGIPVKSLYSICEALLEVRRYEERTIAFDWAYRRQKQFVPSDFGRFERWLKKYVDDWSACDDLCVRPLGTFLYFIPERIDALVKWTVSKNRWVRRASAVAAIPSLRRGTQLDFAFAIAEKLLTDEDYLVQKGYGWMLKEASHKYPNEIFKFVMERKAVMPRTALRYAIEKLPTTMRAQAMKRD